MRVLRRSAAVLALAGLLLVPAAARADELLVMPYSCAVVGGQPVLTPGPEQGHRILGKRDQRRHQACSPVNPGMCRQWTVHRFDLDCDGERVSWVSVMAASNEGSRRAWLLNGRLLLRMGPRWSLAPDDPCAQEQGAPGPDERPIYGGRLQRECAQRLAMAPPAVVEMPFGYAPMLGIDGIFVTAKAPPQTAKVPPPLPPVAAGAPPAPKPAIDPKPPAAPSRAEPVRETKADAAKGKDVPALIPPAPQPAPKVASATKTEPTRPPEGEAAARKETGPPAPKAAPPPGMPKEASPPVSYGPRPVTIPTPPPQEGPKKTASSDARPAAVGTSPAIKEQGAPESGHGLSSLLRPTTTGAIVAFAGLALGLIAAFALARRREQARDAGRRQRNISTMSLNGKPVGSRPDGATGVRPPRMPPSATAKPRPAPGPATARPQPMRSAPARPMPAAPAPASNPVTPSIAMSELEDWDDRMPRTREEALEVLGIGIAPSATAPAIKKIVDGLRMSWHPDLAQNETDRALREQRSKQINAAWDILQGHRAEV